MTYVILDWSLFTGSVSALEDRSRARQNTPERADYPKVLRSNDLTTLDLARDPPLQVGIFKRAEQAGKLP
jgi:hypothetical protein